MGLFTDGFKLLKKASEPLYKTPKSIQETIEIMAVAENGIFEVSKNKYSKCYRFQDINYTTATEDEQIGIFERYCKFLNSLDCNYKITINNKNKNMDELRDKVLIAKKNDGFNNYRRIYNDIIEEKIIEGRQGIEQERYLTITIERKNFEEAKAQFATLEATIHKAFIELGAEIVPLNGNERLKVLYDYYHLGDEGSFDFDIKKAKKVGADFKNDLCNGMVKYFPDHFEDESKFCKALFIKKYPSSLSDRFINEITSLPVHSITSIDVVPVPKDLTTKVLQKKYLGIESDIIKQQRVRNKNNDFSTEISYAKRTEKKEIEEIMDDVRENDQCLFFVGVTIILMAESKKELESVCETVETTPISNTMCEMYVMQLYLQKATLEEMGIYHFDSWAANFGEVTTALELTVEGSGFRFKSRFNKFTNLPELMNIFREVADVQTADMLDLDVPALRGGKPIIVESEPDWYVKQVMEDFVVRAERIRGGGVDPSVDNFLKITHEARLLGTDARLIDKDAPNNQDGKLNKVAENVWKEYEKGNANGHIGCQLIFSDIGTPGPDKDFTIYDYLKETLIQYGIPADEIAFIHDAKTDAQRDALFKEMRTGKKKVLIGSTDKCGTGVNVQTHLVAMHHVDCPWKPSSIEQREGRGIRQGNENEEVAIYRYVTKGTFDAYNWSLVENKQRFISQVMTSKAVSRSCEDIDEATLSYAEIKAVATGNPLIKEKMEIDNDVQRLKLLKASYDNQRYGLQDNFMIKYPKLIKTATEKLANVREDVKARDKELIDNPEFAITIGKATYTERVDGGTMMLEAISKCKTGETTAIGKFHGFELLVEKNFLDINYMVLRGKTEYKAELSTSPVGSMVKLENLFNGLHENIDFLEKKIEQYQNDLEASKAEYDKPFAYSKELEEKLARQCKLNAQLDLENAKAVDADLSGPEEEREADDRMESAAIVAEDKGAYPADREGRTR